MSKKSAKKLSAREARLAEARERQRATERRRALLLTIATGLVVAIIVAAVAWAIVGEKDERQAGADLTGVQEFDYDGQQHVEGRVDYEESPPVGGEHNPAWLNCGVYDEPVPDEHAVHSLEHGTVWITYDPDLPDGEVAKLEDLTPDTFGLLSPYKGDMPGKIVLSAWNHQLSVDSADDPRIEGFIREYRQGPQTPEPGAACTGGVDPSESLVG